MARVDAATKDAGIRTHIIWVPKVGAEADDAADLAQEYPATFITSWWDGDSEAMAWFQAALGIPELAWDAYLIYPAGARWGADSPPPAPAFWMHQLGSPENPRVAGPFLDAGEFRKRMDDL